MEFYIFDLIRNTLEESALSNDIIKLSGGLLELDKPFKLFDMKKFQQNVNRELKRQYPDRRYEQDSERGAGTG